jgi:hypothetical protein
MIGKAHPGTGNAISGLEFGYVFARRQHGPGATVTQGGQGIEPALDFLVGAHNAFFPGHREDAADKVWTRQCLAHKALLSGF